MRLTNATTLGKLQKTEKLTVRTSPVCGVQEDPGVKILKTCYRRTICCQSVGKIALGVFTVQPDLRCWDTVI